MKNIIIVLIVTLFFVACGSDRADTDISSTSRSTGVLGIVATNANVNADNDGDGISNSDELTIYFTNPDNNDTDNDGLSDGHEINTYETNATNNDTDNDGLTDGQEVYTYETNATNPDTDGDCLLDSFEVLNYETNATNPDTDGDSINDGIEVYSSNSNDLNVTCLTVPETVAGGVNGAPAKDNIPADGTDVINALDPTNDNDGDGQANIRENNCTTGDALDSNKTCPYVTQTNEGVTLVGNAYEYIPGGFDVDGDGVKEQGFWLSRYQARDSGVAITSGTIITLVGIIRTYMSENFKVLNTNIESLNYNNTALTGGSATDGTEIQFKDADIVGKVRLSTMTPYLAEVCLSQYNMVDTNGTNLDLNISLPTMKQYVQTKMLLDADKAQGGDGRHIKNGLLGTDPNVSLTAHNVIIEEFSESSKEYTRNLVQLQDSVGVDTFTFATDVPSWWDANSSKYQETLSAGVNGAFSGFDIGQGTGLTSDSYAVIVRGGEVLDVRISLTGSESDAVGLTNGISFRGATDYMY